ncbi:MAG TPA: S41 family peptidase [Chromatiaceae bacterium]|nr:S41 family peptidase [Chromatiaceae bacterium]HIN81583.1 S41 family peptidase [Chromatiales bacterium]HIA08621.1 S41 family peptidase [Chromatiaceae bacterium]HIB84803.1 S41 family peptidase [Chromatiaceae bacterium]HIO14638.1 S41 family peptidase [Chromatiales bacterium]
MKNFWILFLGALMGIAVSTAGRVLAERGDSDVGGLPLEELRTFAEVYGRIKNDYVEEVDDKTLLEDAIRGMLSGLDPHSTYLDIDQFKELQVGTSGEFGGLGIEVGMEDGFVKVISPIDDTPAKRAGIISGDLIVRLDDTPVKGLTLSDAVKIMRGKPGSDIKLTIVREGEDKPLKIAVTRAIIQVQSVKSRMLDDQFGYVRITHFQSKTGPNVETAVKKLIKESENGLHGLVLDLRNNPGGVLNAAVGVSDAFLKEGLIVYTQGRIDDSQMSFQATPEDVLEGKPLVVLVNGGSASASEIVAGALQDHQRAVIMGTLTFGKGSVQTILPMNNRAAMKLTTARYFTPAGRSIQAEGIEPDIILDRLKLSVVESSGIDPIKEANLSGHLDNPNGEDDEDAKQKAEEEKKKSISRDYQLNEALNLLKGLSIMQARNQI